MTQNRPARETIKAVAITWGALMIAVIALLASMHGCTALETERGRLRTAADTWAAVKNSAADAWQAGRLNKRQKKRVMTWTRRGDEALRTWRKRLRQDGPTDGPREMLLRATNILREVWMEARDSTSDGEAQNQGD